MEGLACRKLDKNLRNIINGVDACRFHYVFYQVPRTRYITPLTRREIQSTFSSGSLAGINRFLEKMFYIYYSFNVKEDQGSVLAYWLHINNKEVYQILCVGLVLMSDKQKVGGIVRWNDLPYSYIFLLNLLLDFWHEGVSKKYEDLYKLRFDVLDSHSPNPIDLFTTDRPKSKATELVE
jgi:hypothetical protein